jgi:putative MATE family efflux protein
MDINQEQKQFILEQPLKKVMWKMSLPAIFAMVLYGLNAFMDTIYVGQFLNENALSGIAIAYPLTGIMLGLGSWIGIGAGNYISILLGEDNTKILAKVMPNATLFTLIATLFFTIPSYFFAEDLIAFMGGNGKILSYGTLYFKITLLASPLWVYALQLNLIVRAEGKMKTAAIIMAYGLIVNIILTPIFIHYLDMNVDGAAWGTNIGMLIYCIVGHLYYHNNKASFKANINTINYDKQVFLKIIKLGFPGFIMSLMGLIQAIVVFNAIISIGTERDLAFFAAANRIMLFLMTPLFGLMRALQPVVGVNYGANNYKRVKTSFLLFSKTGLLLILPFWIFLMLYPELTIHLVLPEIQITASDLFNFRIYMAILPFLPYVFMALTYLPAINNPKPASIIGVARQLIFYVPVMFFLPKYIGVSGIYYGATFIDIIITIWMLIVVFKSFKTRLNLLK